MVVAISRTVVEAICAALIPASDPAEPAGETQAAVAVVLLPRPSDVDVLLIRRAERADDHWSGHMAFPGGRRSPGDADLLATAIRETAEEVALDLAREGRVLGRLADLAAISRGHATGMVVRPYVFTVEREPTLTPNHEVVEALWAPVGPMIAGERDTMIDYQMGPSAMKLPGYLVGERIVWGMTYRMLSQLFASIRGVASASVPNP